MTPWVYLSIVPRVPSSQRVSIAGTEPDALRSTPEPRRSGKLGSTVGTCSVSRVGAEGAGTYAGRHPPQVGPTFGWGSGRDPGGARSRAASQGDASSRVAWDIDLERPEWPEGQRSNNRWPAVRAGTRSRHRPPSGPLRPVGSFLLSRVGVCITWPRRPIGLNRRAAGDRGAVSERCAKSKR